ncbi:zinc finger CCCH domain-containing protein 13 isoform X18 [Sander lucioperca]|uniref:zinc finger CCCH domain-containing protein 13 isoform X18 n=1 Tax=Sander lucioperca TaxID=283035 RepID=UPI0016538FA0|nr:zinc finger CCCH domain-containing protein 13 isoform X18 [Sander lucioperca]
MGTQGTGRKRSTKKERSTAEDDALNLIAREAEARLAAKRAARAEAREIRMKELERQQKEIFQVQKKYYGLNTKIDDRADSKWGDIEQWMEDSERYSRSSRIQTLSDDDERMSVGSRGSVRSDLDAVGAYGGGDSSSHKKSKKKKKHKHKDRNGCEDDYSVISSRSSRLSDESRVSRSSRLDLTGSRLSDDTRVSRASRLDLQPASYASSDLYGFNGLSSSRKPGSTFNGYQSALYEDCSGSQRVSSSHPLEYTSYRSSGSRVSSRAGSARASPVDNCSSVASFLRSAANSSGLHRDLDDVTIPDFSDVEDRDYLEKGSRAASALTAATLTSLGGTSSRRGSGETAITVDAETSIREIKDVLVEVEEKYRKAMVSNAQLDNEKNNLMYQVDTLKDSLMELEELLSESRRGYEEKVKEYEREKHAHSVLQFQFSEMKETLKQSEELLNKHGIVLGPDLNINGEVGETEVDGSPSADAAPQPAQDSHASPAEGNSMLGNTEETQLRSSREEEVDPERHQEMFEEAKENHLSTDTLCNVAGVSTLETSSEEQPTEEQQTCLEEDKKTATEEDNVEEHCLSKDSNVDINDQSITEAKDITICSPGLQGIVTSSEKNVPEKERPAGGDLGETETKSSSVDTKSDDIRESSNNLSEERGNKQEDVEESHLRNTEPCPQPRIVMTESLPGESAQAVENTEPQPKPDEAEDAENDEAGEISIKTQPQCAAASGKKKKRKRKSKKKGGTHEDKNQQKDVTDKENDKAEIDIESATREKGPTTEPKVDDSVTETLRGSRVDQVKNEQHRQETEEVDGVKAVKPTEIFSPTETLKESRRDHVTDEHDKEQTLETENVGEAEAVATTETFSPTETLKESRRDHATDEQNKEPGLEAETVEAVAPIETFSHVETLTETTAELRKDEQNKKQTLELEKVEEVGSTTSPVPETDLSTSDHIDNKGAESSDDLDKECTFCIDNSKSETNISTNDDVIHTELENMNSAEDEVGPIDEMKAECSTNNPENAFETRGNKNTDAESHVSSNGDIAADESESTSIAESKESMSVSLSSTDGFTDALISLSGSDLSAAVNSGSDGTPIKVSEGGPKETTEAAKDDEESGTENGQESFSPSVISSALNADRTEREELNEGLREAEGLIEPDRSRDEKSDSCESASLTENTEAFDTVNSPLQAELLDDVESQTLQCEGQIDESNVEVASESEEINTIDMLNTPASPKEATEIGSSLEQNHSTEESAVAEDPEHENSQNDQRSETQRLPEPSKDKSEDNNSSQPTLQGSDEDNGEDDEGQSFDFDDMDVEAAVATSLPKNPEQEENEEGVKVMSDESSNGISVQSKTESNDKSQEEPVERNDETCTVDGGNEVDKPDTVPRDNQNSLAHEDNTSEKGEHVENVCEKQKPMPGEEAGVADEPRHIIEEGKVLNIGELGGVAEDINQATSLPIEEGLDAIKQELQGENLESPKHVEQVASNKEPQQTGKDVKKNGKKGKGKGKEECKMS